LIAAPARRARRAARLHRWHAGCFALDSGDPSTKEILHGSFTQSHQRLSTSDPAARALALARELLEIQSERELDRFLPLVAAAIPMLTNIAGPLLKNIAGSLLGGGGSSKRKRPRDQQEQFLGGIVKGLLGGELESGGYEREQFLGGIFKGLMGGELETEQQERFLGGIIGKLFGGRELEAENYVQEQFLGGIVKGLLGGEMEMEGPSAAGGPGDRQAHRLRRARRFVRLVNSAAGYAAAQLSSLQRAGHRPSPAELRRIVLASMVQAARRFAPRLAGVAFPGAEAPAHGQPPAPTPAPASSTAGQPQPGPTMLELMISEATPLGAPPSNGASRRSGGYPLG
jgi:hypothetical protein